MDVIAARADRTTARGRWLTLAVVAGGLFLAVVSTTVVSVALPTVGRDLHAGAADLEWVVDAYVLVYASLLMVGGVLGDTLGRKGVFTVGVCLFGLGSLASGLAPSIGLLLAGRVVQGLGPALLVPGSLTIIRATFHDERERAAAIGLWSTSSGLAMAVGPVLGGAVVGAFGWRGVFLCNVPLAAALLVLAARFVPRLAARRSGRFDLLGAVLSTVGVAMLAFGTIEGQAQGWLAPPVLLAFGIGIGSLVGFVRWELRSAAPLIDVTLFRRPAFTAANVAALIVFFAFVGGIVYFSAYFQQVRGYSAIAAGVAVSVIGVAYAVVAALSGRLVGRFGERRPLVVGLTVAGAAMLGLLRLGTSGGIGATWWNFALLGAGVGLCGTPMTTIAMSAVDADHAGTVSAVLNAVRQVGQVFGVAVLGALVYGRGGFVAGLDRAVVVSGVALLGAALLTAVLTKPRKGNS